MLAAVCLLAALVLPHLAGSKRAGRPSLTVIQSNLRQLDIYKLQWVADHSVTGAVVLTEQDLEDYLFPTNAARYRLVRPARGEQYRVGAVGAPPEAILTRAIRPYPRGTILRELGGRLIAVETNLTSPSGNWR